MKPRFKPHLQELHRIRTSVGRNLEEGMMLDRNERVIPFPKEVLADLYQQLPPNLLNTYPDPFALYEKLSRHLGLPKEQIFLTNASTEGIKVLFETLTHPGDRVFALSPTYPMYEVYAKIFQTDYWKIVFEPDFSINFTSLFKELNSNTALVCLANPNLPVESLITLEEIVEIAEHCQKFNTVLAIDEAYDIFGTESAVSLLGTYDNLVILRSFSKAFGLAGIRLGYMLSCAENIKYLSSTRALVEASGTSMAIAEYMLDHPQIAKNYVQSVHEGAHYLQARLTEMGVRWHGGKYSNGMLIFLQNVEAVQALIAEMETQKIYLRGSFEAPFDCCIRITLGPIELMEKFFHVFQLWLQTNPEYPN